MRRRWTDRVRYDELTNVLSFANFRIDLFIDDKDVSDEEEPRTVRAAFQDFDDDAEADQRTSAFDTLLGRVLENSHNSRNVYDARFEADDEEVERIEGILREPTAEEPSMFRIACKVSFWSFGFS